MSNDEVLVRVENVSKKFCRSLQRSLWYGVQDMVREILPFGRNAENGNAEKLTNGVRISQFQKSQRFRF